MMGPADADHQMRIRFQLTTNTSFLAKRSNQDHDNAGIQTRPLDADQDAGVASH